MRPKLRRFYDVFATSLCRLGLPRNRLRLVKNKEPSISVTQLIPDLNESCDLNEHDLNELEFYSSESEEEHAPREPSTTVSFRITSNSTKLPCKLVINLYVMTCLHWQKKNVRCMITMNYFCFSFRLCFCHLVAGYLSVSFFYWSFSFSGEGRVVMTMSKYLNI